MNYNLINSSNAKLNTSKTYPQLKYLHNKKRISFVVFQTKQSDKSSLSGSRLFCYHAIRNRYLKKQKWFQALTATRHKLNILRNKKWNFNVFIITNFWSSGSQTGIRETIFWGPQSTFQKNSDSEFVNTSHIDTIKKQCVVSCLFVLIF